MSFQIQPTPLTNLLLQASYPFGFQFQNATPTPKFDTYLWSIPTLNPGQNKDLLFAVSFAGEEGDERVIRFSIGSVSTSSPKTIATSYLSTAESLKVRKPPLALKMTLNNSSPDVQTHADHFSESAASEPNTIGNNLTLKLSTE
jgi:hypothetical protein